MHLYLEEATQQFELQSSLKRAGPSLPGSMQDPDTAPRSQQKKDRESLDAIQTHTPPGVEKMQPPNGTDRNDLPTKERDGSIPGDSFIPQSDSTPFSKPIMTSWLRKWARRKTIPYVQTRRSTTTTSSVSPRAQARTLEGLRDSREVAPAALP